MDDTFLQLKQEVLLGRRQLRDAQDLVVDKKFVETHMAKECQLVALLAWKRWIGFHDLPPGFPDLNRMFQCPGVYGPLMEEKTQPESEPLLFADDDILDDNEL